MSWACAAPPKLAPSRRAIRAIAVVRTIGTPPQRGFAALVVVAEISSPGLMVVNLDRRGNRESGCEPAEGAAFEHKPLRVKTIPAVIATALTRDRRTVMTATV